MLFFLITAAEIARVPAIISFDTPRLTTEMTDLITAFPPQGAIVMRYNTHQKFPDAIRSFVQDLKDAGINNIFTDQEGGAVRRLRNLEGQTPPPFHETPCLSEWGKVWGTQGPEAAIQITQEHAQGVAEDLIKVGINGNCAPCLDLLYGQPASEKHVISCYGRGFGHDPKVVATLGEATCKVFLANGITPVIKHIPGHGQSTGADPHEGICHVTGDISQDIIPFQHIAGLGLEGIWGMTNHVIYDQIDPAQPTVFSPTVVQYIRNHIGFTGPLMTDAIEMGALGKRPLEEKVKQGLAAGHNAVLYCGGKLDEVRTVLEVANRYSRS